MTLVSTQLIMSKLHSIEISKLDNVPEFDKDDFDGRAEKILLDYLNENKERLECYKSIKRGDVIHVKECGEYRNDGKFLYAGREFIVLDSLYDDYGHVPPSFVTIEEFPMNYWDDTISHNCIFHIRGRHLNNLKYEKKGNVEGLGMNYFFSFTHLKKTYTIRYESSKKRIK